MTKSLWWISEEEPLAFFPGIGGRNPLDDDMSGHTQGPRRVRRLFVPEQQAAMRHPFFDSQDGSSLVFDRRPVVVDPSGMFRVVPGPRPV